MIFSNPAGGPELACEECGCRWFDRQTNCCYECGTPVPPAELDEYLRVLHEFHSRKGIVVNSGTDCGNNSAHPDVDQSGVGTVPGNVNAKSR